MRLDFFVIKKISLLTREIILKKEECPERDLRVEALDWLGRRDSNPRVTESKSVALPLGDGPKYLL